MDLSEGVIDIIKNLQSKVDQLEKEKRALKMYVEVTRDSFLEHGFASDSIIMKQADKLLRQ